MGLPVTVYRHTDVGAPGIGTCKPSEIINILKKCLVSGYGTKASLGWTIVAENTSTRNIMFRNSAAEGGSGSCVNVKSHNGTDTGGNAMWFQPCRTATSVTAMTNKGNICSIHCPPYLAYDVWTVVGTAAGFFLIIGKSVNTNGYAQWVNSDERVVYGGDISSSVSGDVSRCVTYSDFYETKNTSTGNTAPDWPNLFGVTRFQTESVSIFKIFDTDGLSTRFTECNVTCGFAALGTESLNTPTPVCDERYSPWAVKIYNYPLGSPSAANYNDRNNVSRMASGLSPYFRGTLLGLIELESARFQSEIWPFYRVINGHNHLALRSATGGVGTFLNLVEW